LPPSIETDFATLHICGGLLVQSGRCDCGEFSFGIEEMTDVVRVTIKLSGYFPLLLGCSPVSRIRLWFYHLTQGAIHRLITVGFLANLL